MTLFLRSSMWLKNRCPVGLWIVFLSLVGFTGGLSNSVQAQLSITEAVSRAESRMEALSEVLERADRAARRGVLAFPNPEFAYHREVALGGMTETEEAVTVSQRFELSGRRAALRRALRHHTRAARWERNLRNLGVRIQTEQDFYRVLAEQARVGAAEAFVERLIEAVARIRHQESAGEASVYDRLRLERELRAAQSELRETEANREQAWAALAVWTGEIDGQSEWPKVQGNLLPPLPAPPSDAALEERADHQALQSRNAARQLEIRAARRRWVPTFGLTAGYRWLTANSAHRDGYVIGAGLSLPLADHGQFEGAVAEAELAAGQVQQQWVEERAGIEVGIAYRECVIRIEAATRFQAESASASRQLLRVADASYRGGELGLLEWIDAQRGRRADELRVIELAAAARNADLRFRRAHGGVN